MTISLDMSQKQHEPVEISEASLSFFVEKLLGHSSQPPLSRIAESTRGKPKQLMCHCVAPANPLENNDSLQIKLSYSMSATGKKVRNPVLWVHSLTLNTCLNQLLHPMDIFPMPWLHWIKVLSSWYGCWHPSPICSHLCVWYFPEKNQPPCCASKPAVSRQPRLLHQAPLLHQLKIHEE